MFMEKKIYSDELKNKITQEICIQGRSTSLVAAENDIPLKAVESWVTKYNKDNKYFLRKLETPEKQIKMLTEEVKRLKVQVDILKKTIALIEKKE